MMAILPEKETRRLRRERIRSLARHSVLSRHVRKGVVLGFLLVGTGLMVWAAVGYFFDPRAALFSQNNLDRTLYLARAAVIEETGGSFPMPVIRAKHRIEINEYFLDRYAPHINVPAGDPHHAERKLRVRDSAYSHSLWLFGIYVPADHEIWVVRSNLMKDEPFWRNPDRSLWLLLLHETAHAADWERYGLEWLEDPSLSDEEHRLWDYLVEGHADHVMVEILKREMGDAEAEEFYLIKRARSGSAYTQGRHFWKTVLADNEITPDEVFRNPPRKMAEVFDPRQYLQRMRRERVDTTSSSSSPTSSSPDLPR